MQTKSTKRLEALQGVLRGIGYLGIGKVLSEASRYLSSLPRGTVVVAKGLECQVQQEIKEIYIRTLDKVRKTGRMKASTTKKGKTCLTKKIRNISPIWVMT